MTFSNLGMPAIMVANAQTLHTRHKASIQSAAQAAEALKPFAGHFASALFALGFIGSGLLGHPRTPRLRPGRHGRAPEQATGLRAVRPQGPDFYCLVALRTVGGTAPSLQCLRQSRGPRCPVILGPGVERACLAGPRILALGKV